MFLLDLSSSCSFWLWTILEGEVMASHPTYLMFCDMKECTFNTKIFQSLDNCDEPLAIYIHSQLEGWESSCRNSEHWTPPTLRNVKQLRNLWWKKKASAVAWSSTMKAVPRHYPYTGPRNWEFRNYGHLKRPYPKITQKKAQNILELNAWKERTFSVLYKTRVSCGGQ